MPRMKSEIFEQYAEIADKVGLTKLAEDSAELKKYKDDPEARVGSDDISTIEALYGVKPEGQEYEFNIMEQAHPNSVVIAPSYDKLNGLVENNIERNKIMTNITLTDPTGNHTNHKYAEQELLLELVRVANEMDARNKEELFKLADSCLIDLSAWQRRPQVKQALAPAIGIAAAVAVVLGAGWLLGHADNTDHGPIANCDASVKALHSLIETSWHESAIDGTVKAEATQLIEHIQKLKGAIAEFNKVSDVIYKPRTLSEMQEIIKLKRVAEQDGATINAAIAKFKAEVLELEPLITQAIDNFSSSVYQKQHTAPSAMSEMTGWLGEALHGRWGLIPNDFISAVNALNTLKASVMDMATRLENFDKIVAKYQANVTNAASKLENQTGTNPLSEPHGDEESDDVGGLIHSITGKKPEAKELDFLNHLMGK